MFAPDLQHDIDYASTLGASHFHKEYFSVHEINFFVTKHLEFASICSKGAFT